MLGLDQCPRNLEPEMSGKAQLCTDFFLHILDNLPGLYQVSVPGELVHFSHIAAGTLGVF